MADDRSLTRTEQAPDLAVLLAAAQQNPGDRAARLRLGWGLLGAGDLEGARRTFEQARRDFPDEIDVLYGLALAAKLLGDRELASSVFQEVADMASSLEDPGRSAILHRLAMGHHNHARSGRWGLKREVWGGD